MEAQYAGTALIRTAQANVPAYQGAVVEHTGGALPLSVIFSYKPAAPGAWIEPAVLDIKLHAAGYFGEYYSGTELEKTAGTPPSNPPRSYRFEPDVFMNWGQSPPMPRFNASNWSARWFGQVELPVGRYKVVLSGDDGVRLWIDGCPVFDQWQVQAPTELTRLMDLTGRTHTVKVEYYQASGGARAQLVFNRVPQAPFVDIN